MSPLYCLQHICIYSILIFGTSLLFSKASFYINRICLFPLLIIGIIFDWLDMWNWLCFDQSVGLFSTKLNCILRGWRLWRVTECRGQILYVQKNIDISCIELNLQMFITKALSERWHWGQGLVEVYLLFAWSVWLGQAVPKACPVIHLITPLLSLAHGPMQSYFSRMYHKWLRQIAVHCWASNGIRLNDEIY